MLDVLSIILILSFRLILRILFGRERRDRIIEKLGFSLENTDTYWILVLSRKLPTTTFLQFLGHEKEVKRAIKDIKGDVFIDIGANLGFFSLTLKNRFKRIISVEPEPNNFLELEENSKNLSDNIECVNIAISNSNSKALLYLSGKVSHSLLEAKSGQNSIEVDTLTLETLMERFHIEGVDLVKVDVEGAEWLVLEGARNVISKIRNWVIELHDWSKQDEMTQLLESYGYNCVWVGDRKHIVARRQLNSI